MTTVLLACHAEVTKAGDRYFASPLTIDPHAKLADPGERQIDQLHFEASAALVVFNYML